MRDSDVPEMVKQWAGDNAIPKCSKEELGFGQPNIGTNWAGFLIRTFLNGLKRWCDKDVFESVKQGVGDKDVPESPQSDLQRM